ncbi:globin domain-containing protein, partial [Sphingobium sp. Ant17]
LAFAQNVDKLDALKPAIERIAARHVQTHIKPDHYPAVANALLPAIRDVLGEAATDDILNAWGEAYWFLADILINREVELYEGQVA